jgi:hypothetical protein
VLSSDKYYIADTKLKLALIKESMLSRIQFWNTN